MESSTFTLIDQPEVPSGYFRFTGPGLLAPVLVQIKATTNTRDLRDSLLSLAYLLEEPQHQGDMALCMLIRSRLTSERLTDELQRFRKIVAPHLKRRIFLTAMSDDGRIAGELPSADPSAKAYPLLSFLQEAGHTTLKQSTKKISRQAIKSTLINRWLRGDGRQTMLALQRDTDASRPTIQAAISDLMGMKVLDHLPAPHGVSLYKMSWPAWRVLAQAHAAQRRVYRYADPSGLARSPLQLSNRLMDMQHKGHARKVALGGVIGARHYYRDLDITAPFRLDLSIYDNDTSFVRELDAGLELSDDPQARPVLVVHQTIEREEFATMTGDGLIASPMDCMADLIECELIGQAEGFSWRLNKMAEENYAMSLSP